MRNLKEYIEYLKGECIEKEDALEMLKKDVVLNNQEKNIIYMYCYPRPLLDRELTWRIRNYRNKNNTFSLIPDPGETALLIEAERTEQYSRFIRHLMHSFVESSEEVFPESGEGETECDLCGDKLLQHGLWDRTVASDDPERGNPRLLVFGSTQSKIHLCIKCLAQLKDTYDTTENCIEQGYYSRFKK